MILVSCHADLDQDPTDPDLFTEIDVFKDVDSAKGALAKIYASLAITGQSGPDGNPDIDPSLIDEGFSARPYHAGLAHEIRAKNKYDFINDDVNIVVTTIAFGMGID